MLWFILYRVADALARALPARAADAVARLVARLVFALRVPARARLEGNLARLLPRAPRGRDRRGAIARTAFERFAVSVAEFLRMGRADRAALEEAIEVRGAEHVEAARASGRGVIVLSAHAGNWEWGAAFLASRGIALRGAARPQASRALEAFYARRRRRWGFARLRGPSLWLAAAAALRRGRWVAMMGDRPAPTARARRRAASGGPSCAWAAALARRTGAIVLPAVMLRRPDGRHVACFEAPLTPEACRAGGYRVAMRRHLAADPGQWLAFEALPEGLA
jgi:lauroyl/myristoyl acyltransferase